MEEISLLSDQFQAQDLKLKKTRRANFGLQQQTDTLNDQLTHLQTVKVKCHFCSQQH